MIDLITREELVTLAERSNSGDTPKVSIYMPTHREPSAMQIDQTRLKNLISRVVREMQAYGLRDIDGFFEESYRLMQSREFLNTLADGLALFIADGETHPFRMPVGLPEKAVVSSRFHLRPLLPFLSHGRFFVILLGDREVRAFMCTDRSIDAFGLPDISVHTPEGQLSDEFRKQLHFHQRVWATGREYPVEFYHQGMGVEDVRNNMFPYFRRLGNVIRALVQGDDALFVLAGVAPLVELFREANDHQMKIAGKMILGIAEDIPETDLHRRALELAGPALKRDQERALAEYARLAGTGETSTVLQEIVPAAYEGRVIDLFVTPGAERWGRFNPADFSVDVHADKRHKDVDLLDFAAMQAFLKGGHVFVLEPDKMPGGAEAAVIFKYGMQGSTPTAVGDR